MNRSEVLVPVPVDPVSLTAYAAFPPELDRDWLGRICHLSEPDLALVRRRADPVTLVDTGDTRTYARRSSAG